MQDLPTGLLFLPVRKMNSQYPPMSLHVCHASFDRQTSLHNRMARKTFFTDTLRMKAFAKPNIKLHITTMSFGST